MKLVMYESLSWAEFDRILLLCCLSIYMNNYMNKYRKNRDIDTPKK